MIKRILVVIIVVTLCSLSFNSGLCSSFKSGKVELKERKSMFDKTFEVSIGDKIKANCKFYIDEFFKKKIIWAGADLENTSSKSMHYAYYVAFFDKDRNIIGCAHQSSMGNGLKPGEKTQLGSCLISLPSSEFAKVKYYQVLIYESVNEVGKK